MNGPKNRVTVSLDADVVDALNRAVAETGAPSVSRYVQDAVKTRMERDEWLARWRAAAGTPDPDALAYARRALLGADPARQHPRAS